MSDRALALARLRSLVRSFKATEEGKPGTQPPKPGRRATVLKPQPVDPAVE